MKVFSSERHAQLIDMFSVVWLLRIYAKNI